MMREKYRPLELVKIITFSKSLLQKNNERISLNRWWIVSKKTWNYCYIGFRNFTIVSSVYNYAFSIPKISGVMSRRKLSLPAGSKIGKFLPMLFNSQCDVTSDTWEYANSKLVKIDIVPCFVDLSHVKCNFSLWMEFNHFLFGRFLSLDEI